MHAEIVKHVTNSVSVESRLVNALRTENARFDSVQRRDKLQMQTFVKLELFCRIIEWV